MARKMTAQDVILGKEMFAKGKSSLEVGYLLKTSDTTARKIRDGHYDHLLDEKPEKEEPVKEQQPVIDEEKLYDLIYRAVKAAFTEALNGDK